MTRPARLGDVVVSMKNGIYKHASAYADDGVACLRMYNIDGGAIVWRDIKRMRVSRGELEEYGLREGDLLVNRVNSRELVGKTACIPASLEPSVFESKNIRVRLDTSKALPKFINYQLLAHGRQHFSGNAQQVVGMASISQKQLANFPIVLTDLDEQRRIVAEIEKQFSRLDEAVTNLKRVKANLKRCKAAVLKAAIEGRLIPPEAELAGQGGKFESGGELLRRICSRKSSDERRQGRTTKEAIAPHNMDPQNIPSGWAWATVDELSIVVTDGDHNPPKRTHEGVPHLTARNVHDWQVDLSGCTFISDVDANRVFRRYAPEAGDLLVTCVGTVGRTAIVPPNLRFSPDRNLAAIRLVEPAVTRFLQLVLESPRYQAQIQRLSGATAQPHLYLGHLRALRVPLPPLSEQSRIVSEVDRLLSAIDYARRAEAANALRVNGLKASVLARLLSVTCLANVQRGDD